MGGGTATASALDMTLSLSPLHTAPRLALRERVLELGPHALADVDLIALLLGTGAEGQSARRVAASLLDRAGDLASLSELGPHALASSHGIGPAKAARIVAALELGRRASIETTMMRRRVLASFDAVADWARPRLSHLDHEEVWLLVLDGQNGLRSARRVAQGGLHGCALTPRDVLQPALRDGASAIVVLHNHPSGDPTPSTDDVVMTRALAEACEVVGVPLLDHVVVARGGAASLRDMGAFAA